MKLHFGAFHNGIDGWVNTDITPHMWISKIPLLPFLLFKFGLISQDRYDQHAQGVFRKLSYVDLCKPLPYASDTVDAIFSSHVLEHLFIDEVERLISECRRVLKPGGVCRVVVPDLEKIVALYDPNDPRKFITDIYEVATRSAVKNSHHCAFTGAFLTSLFTQAGFSKCSVLSYKVGSCPEIELLDNRPESLFFEAIK
ncbi:MAG: methyltransferase domain-containing protein [Gallionella sp.]|nr:methyltransferase domain-containing protein [Gallionella sp.]